MRCEELQTLLSQNLPCEPSPDGARYLTHCLYPSSDPVHVIVSRWGDGFRVTDEGGAVRSALAHGRSVDGMFANARKRYSVDERDGALVAEPPSADWLWAAILAVANASAMAARDAADYAEAKQENDLKLAIYEGLIRTVSSHRVARDFPFRGRSTRMWPIDFAVTGTNMLLIKAVTQNGNSINSNYTAFGDIGHDYGVEKFSVHHEPLKQETSTLLHQVATIVPLIALPAMTERFFAAQK